MFSLSVLLFLVELLEMLLSHLTKCAIEWMEWMDVSRINKFERKFMTFKFTMTDSVLAILFLFYIKVKDKRQIQVQ